MPLPAAAIPLILGAGKTALGAYQGYRAGKMKPKRPTYRTPKETEEIEATYGQMAKGGVPGARQQVEDINRATQNVMSQAGRYTSSGTNLLGMLAQSQATQTSALQQAETQRQQSQVGLMDRYMQAKSNVAQERKQEWDYNQRQRFEEEAAAKAQLTGAAIENIEAGLSDVGGSMIQGNMIQGIGRNRKKMAQIPARKTPFMFSPTSQYTPSRPMPAG